MAKAKADKVGAEAIEKHSNFQRAAAINDHLSLIKKLKPQSLDLSKKYQLRNDFAGKIVTPKNVQCPSEEIWKINTLRQTIVSYLLEVLLCLTLEKDCVSPRISSSLRNLGKIDHIFDSISKLPLEVDLDSDSHSKPNAI